MLAKIIGVSLSNKLIAGLFTIATTGLSRAMSRGSSIGLSQRIARIKWKTKKNRKSIL